MRSPRRLAVLLLVLGSAMVGANAPRPAPPVERWAEELERFARLDRESPPRSGGVVFVGSSSIRLWTTLAADFPGVAVVNRGFGGAELADLVRTAERVVVPHAPRLVVVYAGDNDLAAGKPATRVIADFQELALRLHAALPATRIAFVSIKPSPARWHLEHEIRAANAGVREHASRDRLILYIDVFTPMLGPDGKPRPELFLADGLHLERKGYLLWRSLIAPQLEAAASSGPVH